MGKQLNRFLDSVNPLKRIKKECDLIKQQLNQLQLPELNTLTITKYSDYPDEKLPRTEPERTITKYDILRTNIRRIYARTEDRQIREDIITIAEYIDYLKPLNNLIDTYQQTKSNNYHLAEYLRELRDEIEYVLTKYESLHTKPKELDTFESLQTALDNPFG